MEPNGERTIHQSAFRVFIKTIYSVDLGYVPRGLFDLITTALNQIGERERAAIVLRYGLFDNHFKSLDEVAARTEPRVTKQAISLRIKKGIRQLRTQYYSADVRKYLCLRDRSIS